MKILSLEDMSLPGVKVLLHGFSGEGKTTQAKLLAQAGFKVIIISAESGLLSLKGEKNIAVIDISKDDNGNTIPPHQRFDRLGEAYSFLAKGEHPYDTIILDSLTELNECLIDSLKHKYPNEKDKFKLYGDNSSIMTKMIKAFRDLKYNVVLIALSTVEKDDVGRRFINIDLVGKIANGVPALFDEVIYMYSDADRKRYFLCDKTDKVMAKDRSGKLNAVEEPNLALLINKITGEK